MKKPAGTPLGSKRGTGTLGCLGAMVAVKPVAGATGGGPLLFAIYHHLKRTAGPARWADGSRAHQFPRVREHLLALSATPGHPRDWRPQILALSKDDHQRAQLLRFASWIDGGSGLTSGEEIRIDAAPDEGDGARAADARASAGDAERDASKAERRLEKELRAVEKAEEKLRKLEESSPDAGASLSAARDEFRDARSAMNQARRKAESARTRADKLAGESGIVPPPVPGPEERDPAGGA
ncbi:MAG: hypothetical protein ABIK65_07225 [Candidatus Eisenbacteria bacterium]